MAGRALAPQHWLVMTALVVVGALLITVKLATDMPWLGMTVVPAVDGVAVSLVAPGGPATGKVAVGEHIVAVGTAAGMGPVDGRSAELEPASFGTFAGFNQFFELQRQLLPVLSQNEVHLRMTDGREVSLRPAPRRPTGDLPWQFWTLFALCLVVLLVGVGMWAYRPDRLANRLIAVTAISYATNAFCFAPVAAREWVLNPPLFWWLEAVTDLGATAFSYSVLTLLACYPRRLFRASVTLWCVAATIFVWTNDLFQVIEWPWHTYALPNFVPYGLGLYVGWLQWRATRHYPDQRAALKYFVLSVLITIGLVMFLFELPRVMGEPPLISAWAAQAVICGFFAGLVLGVLRFRLFELERWWFVAWLWFFGGALVVVADLALMYVAHMQPVGALGLALVLVGWIYFPARQWLWGRLVRSPSLQVERYLPLLLETFFAASAQDPSRQWLGLVERIFDPLDARLAGGTRGEPSIEQDGLALAIPDVADDGRHLLLTGRSRGERLFSREDVGLAALILALARKSASLRAAQERGAALERERIARDLHDDVAPQLLTLIHRAPTPNAAEGARNALQTLRETIYTLNDPGEAPLQALVTGWRHEMAERMDAAGVELDWRQEGPASGITLKSRQRLNLARVLREGASNALRHARPKRLRVRIIVGENALTMELANDGDVERFDGRSTGNGLANMRTRIAELGGHIGWEVVDDGENHWVRVTWTVPIAATQTFKEGGVQVVTVLGNDAREMAT